MRSQSLLTVAVVSIVLAVLGRLYLQTTTAAPAQHAAFMGEVGRLKQIDAQIDQVVLQTRYGFVKHYDGLVERVEESRALHAKLTLVRASNHVPLHPLFERARQTFEAKAGRLEEFKSQNSILANSLRYLPGATREVLATRFEEADAHLQGDLGALVAATLRFVLQREGGEKLRTHSSALVETAGETSPKAVNTLLAHTSRLTEFGQRTDALIEEILSLPTLEALDDLEQAVQADYGAYVVQAGKHKLVLFALCLGLFAYGFTTWFSLHRTSGALRDANLNLEQRITARTRELSKVNEFLQGEVAERKRAEVELLLKNKELDEFSFVASHDLQEPLRKLVSFSSMLREDLGRDMPERASEDLYYIEDAAVRMQALVRDLLALSRAGKQAMKRKVLSLDDCLDDALSALHVSLEESGARIERSPLPQVMGDKMMLTQLFQNLVSNALKFTRAGITPVVRLEAELDKEVVRIAVRDNGIGLEPKHAQKIFRPFKRLHGRAEFEGTGIGLSICHKTICRHGGEIWVESKPGEGATFLFTLPASPRLQTEEATQLAHGKTSHHLVG